MADEGDAPPLTLRVDGWDESAIPRRDWIAPGYFLRRSVTVVVGAGGSSKSMLMLTYAAGLAFGEEVHGMRPAGPVTVMLYNVEDDMEEQERRLSAILTRMGRTPAQLARKVIRVAPKGLGALLAREAVQGNTLKPTRALQALIEAVRT